MIDKTIQQLAKELLKLTKRNISISTALDILERTAKKPIELIAINVMRESLGEVSVGGHAA